MKAITRAGDRILLHLQPGEALMLRQLPDLLRAQLDQPGPAARRLFPRFAEDAQVDAELQQLLRADQVAQKKARIAAFAESLKTASLRGGRLELTLPLAEHWLTLLTDLRLILADRLGIEDDTWGRDLDPRRPPSQQHALYFYLSGLQTGLLEHGFGVGQEEGWGSPPA